MEVYNEQMRQILREQSEAEALQGSASGASGSSLTSSAFSDGGSSGCSAVSNSSGGGSSSTAADDERREAVAKALVATTEFEKHYVVQLSRLMALKTKMEADPVLSEELEAGDVFGNIEELFDFHTNMLTLLEKGVVPEHSVAALHDVLRGKAAQLGALYRAYVLNYSVAVFHVKQLRGKKQIEQHLRAVQMRDTAEALKFTEMLAVPCRYVHNFVYFIKALQNALQPSSPHAVEVADLVCTYAALEDDLEKAREQSERMAQLTRVGSHLRDYPDDMTLYTQRAFVCEGDVTLLSFQPPSRGANTLSKSVTGEFSTSSSTGHDELAAKLVPRSGSHLFLFSDVLIIALRTGTDTGEDQATEYTFQLQMPVFTLDLDEETASPPALLQLRKHRHGSDSEEAAAAAAAQQQQQQQQPLVQQQLQKIVFRLSEPRGVFMFGVDNELQRSAWFAHLRAAIASRRRTQVFGVAISDILRRSSEQANDVPSFVAQCLEFLSNEHVLNTEGLFRLSGSMGEIERLRGMVDSGASIELKDVHVACSLLKTWLNVLPQPLLLTVEHGAQPITVDDWGAALRSSEQDPNKFDLVKLVGRLSRGARFVTCSLFRLLCRVVQHSGLNKMDAHNVAIVFAPTLFKSNGSADDILKNTVCTDLISTLIEHFDRVFSSTIAEQSKYCNRMHMLQARAYLERAELNSRVTGRSPRLAAMMGPAYAPSPLGDAAGEESGKQGKGGFRRRAVSCFDRGTAALLIPYSVQPQPQPITGIAQIPPPVGPPPATTQQQQSTKTQQKQKRYTTIVPAPIGPPLQPPPVDDIPPPPIPPPPQ